MIYKPFNAMLIHSLDKQDTELPISETDKARLLEIVPIGESIPLVLHDDFWSEEILVRNSADVFIVERGEHPRRFPRGSVLCFEVTVGVVKDLICTHNCCDDEPCPCQPISIAGILLPVGKVGELWQGTAIFQGDLPMALTASGLPPWTTVVAGPNFLSFTGTPTVPLEGGNIAIAGTNCAGSNVVTATGVLTISE
jgi:hypothetical protein